MIWDILLILSSIFFPSVWNTFTRMLVSGNLFLEVIGGIGLIAAIVGFVIILYFAIIFFVFTILIAIFCVAPLIALYLFLGPGYFIILAAVIAAIALLYLIETRTVRTEHHTVTVGLNRRYIIKR